MRRLSLTSSSFRQLRGKNKIYVDKTRWIYKMISEDVCYFFSRPRRFGKSLTISTLKELFKGNKELFNGLYIYDKWEFREHPVLVFDFNSISCKNPDMLERGLREKLLRHARTYEIGLEEGTLEGMFDELIVQVYKKYNSPVVVLIDEYDKPIIEHLGQGKDRLDTARANREMLADFFGVLKGVGVVDELGFMFVTGVSYFTKVSIFSKWNNLNDISTDREYADFLGYNDEEIRENFEEYLKNLADEYGYRDIDACMQELQYWYNGYRFSPDVDKKVYNPVSVMFALQKKVFNNFWFQTGTPTFLVNLLREKPHKIPEMEQLKVSSNFLQAYDLENLGVEAILYQTGYLTIKDVEGGYPILSYPNREVKDSFQEVLLTGLQDPDKNPRILADDLGKAIRENDFEEARYLLDLILGDIPHRLYEKKDEAYFHVIFYLAMSLSGYRAESEVLSYRGRLDMAVKYDGENRVYVFEFKTTGSAKEAIKQIEEKGYAKRYEAKGYEVMRIGVVFDVDRRKVAEMEVG